jgi:hypothetical protein
MFGHMAENTNIWGKKLMKQFLLFFDVTVAEPKGENKRAKILLEC